MALQAVEANPLMSFPTPPASVRADIDSGAGTTLDTRLAIAAAGIAVVIVYGSLFPFHFQARVILNGPLIALLSTWRIPDDRADALSNFLLYLPFGLFSVRALRGLPRWALVPLVTIAGCALSMCMEMIQFYDPGRDSAMADVYANAAGTFAGALAAACLKRDLSGGARVRVLGQEIVWRPFAILLIACWLGNRLFPYFPPTDFHDHWTSVLTLLAAPAPLELYKQSVYWLAAAVMLESITDVARSRVWLALMVGAALFARAFLVEGAISSAEIWAPVVAAFAWAALSRWNRRAAVVAILFGLMVVVQALDPFHLLAVPRQFGWIPFASFMQGSRAGGVRVFFEKAFTYGALVWLPVRAGVSFPIATIAGATLVFCLRQAQVFLPGRSAEITDAVMVLMMAGAMYLVREPRR
jgi:VanZ family protein